MSLFKVKWFLASIKIMDNFILEFIQDCKCIELEIESLFSLVVSCGY